MALTHSEARTYYDRFGIKQDSQSFYEDAALEDLIVHADFRIAKNVLEFGSGTGRLALELLEEYLQPLASYVGLDSSQTMVNIARRRLLPFNKRTNIVLSDGSIGFPVPDNSIDRVVSTYVFDLLSMSDIGLALHESRRVLSPGGKLCLITLTTGKTPFSKTVSFLWSLLFKLHPSIVGGCRPLQMETMLGQCGFETEYRNTVVSWGISSEILISRPREKPR